MTEAQRVNVRRLVSRVEGGAKAENLKRMCRTLGIVARGKAWNLAALEVKLRALQFRQYENFKPTSQDIRLSKDDFFTAIQVRELPQFPGHFEYISYSIGQVCAALQVFVESKNAQRR